MSWLLFIHSLLFSAWAHHCYPAALVLIRDVETSGSSTDALMTAGGGGGCGGGEEKLGGWWQSQRRHERHMTAWGRILRSALVYGLGVAYIHHYMADHYALVARRDAARMQEPPYHCNGNMDHPPGVAAWMLSATVGPSLEQACADYLAAINLHVWPNPLHSAQNMVFGFFVALADHAGRALHLFLSNFAYVMQGYILILVPAVVIVLILLAPYVGPMRSGWRPRRELAHHTTPQVQLLEDGDDGGTEGAWMFTKPSRPSQLQLQHQKQFMLVDGR